jgi:hypothetical protein
MQEEKSLIAIRNRNNTLRLKFFESNVLENSAESVFDVTEEIVQTLEKVKKKFALCHIVVSIVHTNFYKI